MVRLRSTPAVRVLTFEEKTRVANLFMLLIEVDLQKGVTRKRRVSKSAKTNTAQCKMQKTKHKPIDKQPSYIFCVNNKTSRKKHSSRIAQRDLPLNPFVRIFRCNVINFIWGYSNDRHHNLNAC